MKWFRRGSKNGAAGIDEAKKAVEASHRRGEDVDALVRELRERRIKNQFAPTLAEALGTNRKR